MNEFFCRKCTQFEFSRAGRAILEGDLGRFHFGSVHHFDQTAIADGNALDIRSQILERGLAVPDRFAVYDPIAAPDISRYLRENGSFAQEMLEPGAKQSG